MKYGKYKKLIEKHPFLEYFAWEKSSSSTYKTLSDIKSFISEKLKYIAYRPWENLDLMSEFEFNRTRPISNDPIERHHWYNTSYVVYFWIGDEKKPRARSVACEWDDRDDERTIQGVIDEIRNWYSRCFLPKGISIKWEAVVKGTSRGGVSISPCEIEVFQFPEDFA